MPALALGFAELLVHSNELDLILNSLISALSGTSKPPESLMIGEGLRLLAMLNTMTEVDEEFWGRVKEFRIVLLLKTVLPWPPAVESSTIAWVLSTEILRLIRSLLPWIKDIDSGFWKWEIELLKHALKVRSSLFS